MSRRDTEVITDQPDAMPVFVLKAKDKLALSAVFSYQMLCENAGLDEQADQVALAVEEIREWQRRNPDRLQLPDHPHVPVEGSTPIASPARPCGMHYSWQSDGVRLAGTLGPCVLDVADHHERHRDEHGNEWLNVQWALNRLDAEPAGEVASVTEGWTRGLGESQDWDNGDVVVSVPLPAMDDEPGRHDPSRCSAWTTVPEGKCTCPREPAPVPPPVDALERDDDLTGASARTMDQLAELIDDWDQSREGWRAIRDKAYDLWAAGVEEGRRQPLVVKSMAQALDLDVDELYAAGVAEGRRQRDAEIHANVFTSARLAAAEAGFAPAPESVTVSYERRANAYEEGIYDAGIAEGRRQAAEERLVCTRCGHADAEHRAGDATCTGDHTTCLCTRVPVSRG